MRASPTMHFKGLFTVTLILISIFILQGCDGITSSNEAEYTPEVSQSSQKVKLRHPNLLESARQTVPGEAGKSAKENINLFLAFNQYEADGITPRMLNKFEVTNRILNEYGITRRVLEQYGITRRILNQYGITRRILNQYDITRRMLSKYGITPRLLAQYNDKVNQALLQENGITGAVLAKEGVTAEDLKSFNKLSAILKDFDVTLEEFIEELDNAIPSMRVKVYVENAHLGMAVSVESEYLDSLLEEIADDPDVLFIEPDAAIDLNDLAMTSGAPYDNQLTPWGISTIKTPVADYNGVKNTLYNTDLAVQVFVLDSGAMPDVWYDDVVYVEKKDFTMLFDADGEEYWEEDFAPDVAGFDPGEAGNPYDESGHGSHVTGTIGALNNRYGVKGIAPGALIRSLKVLNKKGQTDVTTLLAAVDYVTRFKLKYPPLPVVVNLSLGMDIGTTEYNILDEAIAASIEAGVVYVVAAGNDGKDASTYSPAHVDGVITVGAFNENGQFSSFSNFGPVVDILAPGENVISLSHYANEIRAHESILASGTSYATPHVTGAVVLFLGKYPRASPAQVKQVVTQHTRANITQVPAGTTNRSIFLKYMPIK